jgi:hypothetical protein
VQRSGVKESIRKYHYERGKAERGNLNSNHQSYIENRKSLSPFFLENSAPAV